MSYTLKKIPPSTVCLFTIILLGLSGCAKQEIRARAVSYNGALSEFGNSQILLNAVRAAKRYPIYYSAIGELTADESLNGHLDSSFPFLVGTGRHITLPSFTLGSRTNVSSGIQNFKVGNLNNQEFQKRMFDEVSLELFRSFLDNGWPQELLFTLMIQQIKVPGPLDMMVQDQASRRCAQLNNEQMNSEYELTPLHKRRLSLCKIVAETEKYAKVRQCEIEGFGSVYFNKANRPCSYMRFQNFYRRLRLLGGGVFKTIMTKGTKVVSEKVTTYGRHKKVETKLEPTKSVKTFLSLKLTGTTGASWILKKGEDDSKGNTATFELRSAHKMIQYLGEVISAQLFIDNSFVPMLAIGRPTKYVRVPLLKIRTGPLGAVTGTVRVRHEGRTYYIPRPDYGSETEARSLQAIAVINQVIAHQTSSDSLPKSQTFNLVSSN